MKTTPKLTAAQRRDRAMALQHRAEKLGKEREAALMKRLKGK